MSNEGYWRRKNKTLTPRISVYKMASTEGIQKMSGQITDPFYEAENKYLDKVIKPPYSLSTLLDFYEDNTWHNACCNIKANLVCGSWDIVGIKPDQKPDAEYDTIQNFIDTPNENGELFFDLLNKFWLDQEMIGNSNYEIVRNRGGLVSEIYHMPGHTVRKAKDLPGYFQVRGPGGLQLEIKYFRAWGDPKDKEPGNETMRLLNYFPASSYYGLPDFLPALGAMILDRNMILFNNNFFDNSGLMGSILFVKGAQLDPQARLELKNMIKKNFTGVDNAHRFAIIDGLNAASDFKIEKVMENVREISFHTGRVDNRDEIIASHHVPPKMLHIPTAGQLGQSQDGWNQMKFFKIVEIDPSQRRFEHLWNRFFKIEFGIKNWKLKFKEMEVSDKASENQGEWGDIQNGIQTVNEIRAKRGLEPLEESQIQNQQNKKLAKILSDLEQIEQEAINT